MPITNNNIPQIDLPPWEQLPNWPANSAAGSCVCDDNERYAYYLISATSFWRYDTYVHCAQQLPSPPGGTVTAGSCIRFVRQMGAKGSVYVFQAAGASVTFYRYDVATNTWSAALSVANVPGGFTGDGRLVCPEPFLNNFQGGYHNALALNVITTTATANAGATTIAVSALPLALPSGACINFGTAAAPLWATLTAAAAAAATSLTVSALAAQIPSASTGLFYADMFLFGGVLQVVYRYNFAANAWVLTSANSGNPAIPAVGTNVGAGAVAAWLPGSGEANALNTIQIVCGGATSTIREYNMVTNAFTALTYIPSSETFTTGTASAVLVGADGRNAKLAIQRDVTQRFFCFDRTTLTMQPLIHQYLVPSGTALVGDRCFCMKHQGIPFLYHTPSTSPYLVRAPLTYVP